MPSYAITGTSRGIGVRVYYLAKNFVLTYCSQLAFIKVLGIDPANTVFALVRNPGAAQQLNDFVATHSHKNVHILKADNDDIKSIQVCV